MSGPTPSELDVLVVGAGQAGLAAGYWLGQSKRTFVILERAARIGESWRQRYDSLTLFTPRAFSSLPGMVLSGDPEGYAAAREFADYLEAYAAKFSLPVRTSAEVRRLERREDGPFLATLSAGSSLIARAVIVAAGAFQKPRLPALAAKLDGHITQLTLGTYHRPADTPEGTVMVVGDGASGRDIAADLAGTRRVLLATGRKRRLLPEHLLGRSIWWWLNATRLMRAGPTSPVGRIMRAADPFPNRNRGLVELQRLGIVTKPRVLSAGGSEVTFADGTRSAINAVVWTVGYEDDTRWIDISEAKDGDGGILSEDGRSPVPGLYHLGRPWQRNRASALIMGAGPDAKVVVDHLLAHELEPDLASRDTAVRLKGFLQGRRH